MLLENGTAEVITKRGSLLFSPALRPLTHSQAVRFQSSEPDTIEWIDEQTDDAVFWDIGANIGVFSLYAGLKPTARVLAFEPAAGSFALLSRNIELNGMAERISAYCAALAGDTKLDSLNMANTAPGSDMHGFGAETDQFGRVIDVRFLKVPSGSPSTTLSRRSRHPCRLT